MKASHIRGVNLGGWLVLERWITPSLFQDIQGQDEYSLCLELGKQRATRRLEGHRKTFITEGDIRKVKQLGLNAVRVPVGYWLFGGTDTFVGNAYRYLDLLFTWAEKYELKVVICLHGAPGSQNGWDHSGRAGEVGWLESERYVRRTLRVVKKICERYGQQSALYGIELLNEPHPSVSLKGLMRYYRQAVRTVRSYCHKKTRCIVSDAFRPKQMVWRIIFHWVRRPILDQHMYQLFTAEDRDMTFGQHLLKAQSWFHELRWRTKLVSVIVGEWCAVMDEHYQPELARTAKHFSQDEYVRYSQEQRRAFERAGCGWFYWTARVEDRGPWSLLDHPELLT